MIKQEHEKVHIEIPFLKKVHCQSKEGKRRVNRA